MPDLGNIAGRYFAPAEAAAAANAPSRFFFPIWTAKEAVIKAIGEGLSIEFASFGVIPSPTRFTVAHNLTADGRLDG